MLASYFLWESRALATIAPAIERWINSAIHTPAVARARGICCFGSIKNGESQDQSQNCKKEHKDLKLSEKLHLFSPPFEVFIFNSMFYLASSTFPGGAVLSPVIN